MSRLVCASLLLAALPACAPVSDNRSTRPDADAGANTAARQTGAPDGGWADLSRAVELIVSRTNDFRAGEGRRKVKTNGELAAAADYFAKYMARTRRYGHTADGQEPAARARKHGYAYCLVSENIAYQYSSADFQTEPLAQGFVTGWKESPGHRKNMLDPDVVETGVAVARAADGTYYAVQMFGRPESMRVEFKVTNRAGVPVGYTLEGQTFPLPPRVTRTHAVCRPPRVDFTWGRDQGPEGTAGGDVFAPRPGSHYLVTRDAGGRFAVREEAGEGK